MVLMEKFLYKQDSKGKIRQWRGYVDSAPNNRFIMGVETGLVDGNKTANRPRIYWQGKQGRDAKGQAMFELESKVSKKRDEGYFDTIQEAKIHLLFSLCSLLISTSVARCFLSCYRSKKV